MWWLAGLSTEAPKRTKRPVSRIPQIDRPFRITERNSAQISPIKRFCKAQGMISSEMIEKSEE